MKKFLATIVSSFTPYKVSISETNITDSRAEKRIWYRYFEHMYMHFRFRKLWMD